MKKTFLLFVLAALLPMGANAYLYYKNYDAYVDGIYYKLSGDEAKVTYEEDYVIPCYSGSVVIPSTITYEGQTYRVTAIDQEAFYHCTDLTSVTFGDNVTSIGWRAFSGCTGLTSITIPENVTYTGGEAFYECEGLQAVTICNGEIAEEAFSYCFGLTSLTLGDGVTCIGNSAFLSCLNLPSLTIPSNVTRIEGSAFSWCRGLTSLEIQEGVTYIGWDAFSMCTNLTSVTIPGSLANIADKIFSYCDNLSSITIPESVNAIGEYAFSECGNLTDVSCMAVNVPATDNNAFKDSPIASATLHVPAASIEAYRTTAPWSEFGTIVPVTATGIANVGNVKDEERFDLQGRRVSNPQKGIYIKEGRKVLIK